jgi:competence protein ComEC
LGIGRNNYNNKHLTATFLSVGGADCCYVSLPGNKNLLVDVGCEARFTGEGVKQDPEAMLAFLRQRGIKTIDYLVLSHPHLDHYGGLEELLSGFKVKAIFISSDRDWDGVLGTVPENRFYVLQKGAAIHFGPDLRGDILHPPDKLLLNTGSDTNNNSLVFRLQYKGFSLLFAGDIEASAEQVLPVESLKSTVLKVAHHGSPTSTTSDFLQKVQPQYAIISKGSRGNSSEVEARLVASGAVVLSTEKNGAIRITTDGRTVRLATVKKWVTH